MVNIKICGIRRQEDILYLNKYLPQYAGFVFAEESKRRVSPDEASALIKDLDIRIKPVGVFVNENMETLVNVAKTCGLEIVQLHGDESPDYLRQLRSKLSEGRIKRKNYENRMTLNIQVWKAFRVNKGFMVECIKKYNADAYLLDSYSKEGYGGTGELFNWDIAIKAKKYGNIILAGGLNPLNAIQAAEYVKPFALDVSSGVETNGYKDEDKIRNFIQAVKNYKLREAGR